MKKLRLLITDKCNKKCKGCCNKEWDLKALPIINLSEYKEYDEILITGGEPTFSILHFTDAVDTIIKYKKETCKIYVYINGFDPGLLIVELLNNKIDGITLTLHTTKDVKVLQFINEVVESGLLKDKSLRLNIFDGVKLPLIDLSNWKVRSNIKWIKNCPLPKDEEFKRYE